MDQVCTIPPSLTVVDSAHSRSAAEARVLVGAQLLISCAGASLRRRTLTVRASVNELVGLIPCPTRVDWELLGNQGWNWKNYDKYLKRAEGYV